MRVWGHRYNRDLQRYSLALRMIGHEARTHTICEWTGLPPERIRILCRTYARDHGKQHAVRHRGPSPQNLSFFLRSSRLRSEAAAIAGLCYVLDVIPSRRLSNARRELPNVGRGQRMCLAFEMYRKLVPASKITLEHIVLLVTAIAQGNELRVIHCLGCGGAIIMDRFELARRRCTHCSERQTRGALVRLRVQSSAIGEASPGGQQPLL